MQLDLYALPAGQRVSFVLFAMGFESTYSGRTAMVLGAAGFIGRWVALALARAGAAVVLAVREERTARAVFERHGIRGIVREIDLSRRDAIRRLYSDFQPAITFNLAGYGVGRSEQDPDMAHGMNVELVDRLCAEAGAYSDPGWSGRVLVHAGSAQEYGAIGGDLSESSDPRPTTLYGRSKLEGTRRLVAACRSTTLGALGARLFTVYGPGERSGRLLPSLIRAAMSGATVSLSEGTQRRDFTYVGEVAEGLLRLGACAATPGEIVNLATGRLTSVREFAVTAAEVLGIGSDRLRFGEQQLYPDEMDHSGVSVARLERLTSWRPRVGIRDGVRLTAGFELANRPRQPEPHLARS
jgi:nucleoside-diphosphate-sugar epimerase